MLRSKRQRSSQSNEHYGGGSDDELLRMNPSLMTERQQLAFLLRKTAQDASASDSAQSSDSSEDELIQIFSKRARRIQRAATSSPRRNSATNSSSNNKSDGAAINRGRGRPPKSAAKPQHGHHDADGKTARDASPEKNAPSAKDRKQGERRRPAVEKSADTEEDEDHSPSAKKLKVATAEELASGASKSEKSSPSSSSDVLHMETFESDASPSHAGDFWSLHCALCCAKNASSSQDVPLCEALFLCPSCDRKYPTQRALGRV